MSPPEVALVIPVNNEAASLPVLFGEIAAVAHTLNRPMETIVVDDGSSDASWEVIRNAATGDSSIRGIRLQRNFGKTAALLAGFAAARAPVIVTLDADLQDDPAEIPWFLAALDGGLDVVCGWKKIRRDSWLKRASSRLFNAAVSLVSGVRLHDHNCGYKACRAVVLRAIPLDRDLHRFIAVLAGQRGYCIGEIIIHHRPRQFGRSHYGLRRIIPGLRDLFRVRFLTIRTRPRDEQYAIRETTP